VRNRARTAFPPIRLHVARSTKIEEVCLATPLGFEPRITPPKSAVLLGRCRRVAILLLFRGPEFHRGDGQRFIVRADEELTAFLKVGSARGGRAHRELAISWPDPWSRSHPGKLP